MLTPTDSQLMKQSIWSLSRSISIFNIPSLTRYSSLSIDPSVLHLSLQSYSLINFDLLYSFKHSPPIFNFAHNCLLSLSLYIYIYMCVYIYIYIYIYICVCVCVCVCVCMCVCALVDASAHCRGLVRNAGSWYAKKIENVTYIYNPSFS